MSKQHPKTKPDPGEVRDRHLHRIELYEKQQRNAAASGKSLGIGGRLRGMMLAFARRLSRLLPADSPAAGIGTRTASGKPPVPHAKQHPRRAKPKRKR